MSSAIHSNQAAPHATPSTGAFRPRETAQFYSRMDEAERLFSHFDTLTPLKKQILVVELDAAYDELTKLTKKTSNKALPEGISGQQFARLLYVYGIWMFQQNTRLASYYLKASIIFQIVDNYKGDLVSRLKHVTDSSVSDLLPDEFRKMLVASQNLMAVKDEFCMREARSTFPKLNEWLMDNSKKGIHITGENAKEISLRLALSLRVLGQCYTKMNSSSEEKFSPALFTAIYDIAEKLEKPHANADYEQTKNSLLTTLLAPKPVKPNKAESIDFDDDSFGDADITQNHGIPRIRNTHEISSSWKELAIAILIAAAVSAVFIAIGIVAKAPLLIASGAIAFVSGSILLARWHFSEFLFDPQTHYGFAAAYPPALSIAAIAFTILNPIPAAIVGAFGGVVTGVMIYKEETA